MKRLALFLSVLAIFFIVSCSKSNGDPQPPGPPVDPTVHVSEVKVDPAEFVLLPTLTLRLSATVLPANAGNKKLTWTSSNTSVANVDTSGLVTALTAGSADIIATSNDNSSLKDTAKLTVLTNYNVYVAGKGFTSGPVAWDNCAVYWKNGVKSGLTGGYTVGSNAYAITLSGTDEYIAGNTINQNQWGIPTYWKNGVPHIVGDQSAQYSSYTTSIAVDANKVYLAGYSFYNTECPSYCFGRFRGWYFLDNGGTVTRFPLYDAISSTLTNGIAVKGSDVYIAGAQANDNFYRWATVWKNNVSSVQTLSSATGYYQANALGWLGNDLYFAASGGCPDLGCISASYLIKNNISNTIALTNGTRESKVSCIAFSGNTVYVGGYEKNQEGKSVAKYWKINGNTVIERTLSDGTKSTAVAGIAVSGDDIFLVGTEVGSAIKAKCWRAYEGFANPAFWDVSDNYVPTGYEANGIYIK